jgi:hypothetical protein
MFGTGDTFKNLAFETICQTVGIAEANDDIESILKNVEMSV